MTQHRSVAKVVPATRTVEGGGFVVRRTFPTGQLDMVDPFLLLDHMGPQDYGPGEAVGAPDHPHRGFETVTYMLEGAFEHHDSSGGGGYLGPGDVQWMTAGAGIVHEEFHGRGFAQRGGRFEMVQLWVNLPARDKLSPPGYQAILDEQIPALALPGGQGVVRVIAGEFRGRRGPARTFTPMHVWDLSLAGDQRLDLDLHDGWTTALVVLHGSVRVNGSDPIGEAEVGLFDRAGERLSIDSASAARVLLLSGEPIDEPIVGRGPFVMNTAQEIRQAMDDYSEGRMGHLS
jgi:redox-sensitive bicupin YhaK (pirin superfamily)